MARTTAGMVAMVAIMTAGAANSSNAAPDPEPVVVLHVTDYAHVSPSDLSEAQKQAARVYQAAGVRTIWTDGAAQTARADGAFHVDVVLVPNDKTAGQPQGKAAGEQPLARPRSRPGAPTFSTIPPSITRCAPAPTSLVC